MKKKSADWGNRKCIIVITGAAIAGYLIGSVL